MKNQKNRDIYVSDISFDVVEEDIRKLFAVCGTVRAVTLMNDENSGKFIGRAYVRMSNTAETKDAINTLDGTRLVNRCIRVCAARQKQEVAPITVTSEEKPRRRKPLRKKRH